MVVPTHRTISRRTVLGWGLALPLPFIVGACSNSGSKPSANANGSAGGVADEPTVPKGTGAAATSTAPAQTTAANASPAVTCTSAKATLAQTEGPFFTAGSPERTSLLESGMGGTKLVLSGVVMSTACKPIAKAKLDFWQADDKGVYDNSGFRLRGHQFTDDQGRYRLETVVPGLYTGRTEHIHVKIQAPGKAVVTSQLYFPDVARNTNDGSFDATLLIAVQGTPAAGLQGKFDFVVA